MGSGVLKKQLALAVRNIQWSYAIYWSISARQHGVLEWGDGYYNGDIKTRKTIHSTEHNADPLALQRSEQLRELFESLSAGEASLQAKRPSAALSPEDLTDTEWYYLVCMSFVFNIGQGLPGRTLANGRPIWLSNAPSADSKLFTRSLLAKSASIQTIVCFPFSGGVIELGVTDLVLEDRSLIEHIKASFLEAPLSVVVKKSSTRRDVDFDCPPLNHEVHETNLVLDAACEDVDIASPKNSSNCKQDEDSFMRDERNGGASQEQSWQIMEDDFSNCILHSVNSSDDISQTIAEPVKDDRDANDNMENKHSSQEVGGCNHAKQAATGTTDVHYQFVLSSLLKTSLPLIFGAHSHSGCKGSNFTAWKKVGASDLHKSRGGTPQKLLKKILLEVPRMHSNGRPESLERDDDDGDGDGDDDDNDDNNRVGAWRPEAEDFATSHVVSERRRRERINERFTTLKTIVPSVSKVDKVSILDDTIQYLQQLERRIQELESCKVVTGSEAGTKRKPNDTVERTSDNYGSNRDANGRRPSRNKRKICDTDDATQEDASKPWKDGPSTSVSVSTNNKDVHIEIRCPWRDGILLEIMDAMSSLQLDSHSVRSTTVDGILSISIKAKLKKATAASAGAIKQALQKVAWK